MRLKMVDKILRLIDMRSMKMRSIEVRLMKLRSIEGKLMKLRSIEGKLIKMTKPASTCDKQAGHWQEQRSRNRRASRCLTPWAALNVRDTRLEVDHIFLLGDY